MLFIIVCRSALMHPKRGIHLSMRQENWKAAKATRVLSALERIGWRIKRQKGSHRTLKRSGWPDFIFAYHDRIEIGPIALKKLAPKTGLTPDDL